MHKLAHIPLILKRVGTFCLLFFFIKLGFESTNVQNINRDRGIAVGSFLLCSNVRCH